MKHNNHKVATSLKLFNVFNPAFLSLVIFGISTTAFADDSSDHARSLINDMSNAANQTSYDGVFIYSRGQNIDTMRLIRRANENGIHERLVSMSGHAREVIRNNGSVTCIFPENQKVMVEKMQPRKLFAAGLPEPIEKIAQNYTFKTEKQGRVAGREAWVVDILPRDAYRYGYELWIDKQSKLLLKSVLRDHRGNSVEQLMFTQIELMDSVPDNMLRPELTGKNYVWDEHESSERTASTNNNEWALRWMPNGFIQSEYEQQTSQVSGLRMDHITYSDGLAMVSVFIEKMDTRGAVFQGARQMGGVNAFTVAAGEHQVTVVGEVPRATVQKMAVSISKNP